MLNDGRHNILKGFGPGGDSWEPLPKNADDQPGFRAWSCGRDALLIKGPVDDVTRVIVVIDPSGGQTDIMNGLAMVVGVQQGLFSPDRFDAQMGLELSRWVSEQVSRFKASNGQPLKAVRKTGDIAIVLVIKKGNTVVQFRHKDAPDDFNGPE